MFTCNASGNTPGMVFFSLFLTFVERRCVFQTFGFLLPYSDVHRAYTMMLTACTVFDHCSRWRCVTASANPDFDLCVARAASKVVSIGCGCDEVLVLKSEACRYIWDCSWNERRPGSRRRDEIWIGGGTRYGLVEIIYHFQVDFDQTQVARVERSEWL